MDKSHETYLGIMEGISQITDLLDGIRASLEGRGWDHVQAQRAAIMAYDNAMKQMIAAMDGE